MAPKRKREEEDKEITTEDLKASVTIGYDTVTFQTWLTLRDACEDGLCMAERMIKQNKRIDNSTIVVSSNDSASPLMNWATIHNDQEKEPGTFKKVFDAIQETSDGKWLNRHHVDGKRPLDVALPIQQRILVDAGCDLNPNSITGDVPLIHMYQQSSPADVPWLIQQMSLMDSSFFDAENGVNTPLSYFLAGVWKKLRQGVNPDRSLFNPLLALMSYIWSVDTQHPSVIRELADIYADESTNPSAARFIRNNINVVRRVREEFRTQHLPARLNREFSAWGLLIPYELIPLIVDYTLQ